MATTNDQSIEIGSRVTIGNLEYLVTDIERFTEERYAIGNPGKLITVALVTRANLALAIPDEKGDNQS